MVGFPPKSSILIGFSIIFTIHFGVPLFSETSISKYQWTKVTSSKNETHFWGIQTFKPRGFWQDWYQYGPNIPNLLDVFEPSLSHVGTCWEKSTQTFLHQRQGTRKIKRSYLTFEMVLTSDTASHTVSKGPMHCTLPETNRWLEDEFPFGAKGLFSGAKMLVSGRVMFLIGGGVPLVLWNCWMFLLKRVYLLAYYHGWLQISVSSRC